MKVSQFREGTAEALLSQDAIVRIIYMFSVINNAYNFLYNVYIRM